MYGTYVWSSYQLQKYIFFTKLMRNLIFILTPLKFLENLYITNMGCFNFEFS